MTRFVHRAGALSARCVVIDIAWQDSYAEAPIELHRHPPPPLPGQNSAPVGVIGIPRIVLRR